MNQKGLKSIAIFEAMKGVVALLVGFGIHTLSGGNVQETAETVVAHLHLNSASHYPSIFLRYAGELSGSKLVFVAVGAFVYSIVRFVEAYGLWRGFRWTQWLALIGGAIYLPFEGYEFAKTVSALSALLLAVNTLIVWYIYWELKKQRKKMAINSPRSVIPSSEII